MRHGPDRPRPRLRGRDQDGLTGRKRLALTPTSTGQAVKIGLLQLPRLCTHTFMYTFRPSLIDRSRNLYALLLVRVRVFFFFHLLPYLTYRVPPTDVLVPL